MNNDYLIHHGILGQKWGVRRYQNPDGSLTAKGEKRYDIKEAKTNLKKLRKEHVATENEEWKEYTQRLKKKSAYSNEELADYAMGILERSLKRAEKEVDAEHKLNSIKKGKEYADKIKNKRMDALDKVREINAVNVRGKWYTKETSKPKSQEPDILDLGNGRKLKLGPNGEILD